MAPKLVTHFLCISFFCYLLFHKIISAAQQTSNEKQILLNIKNDWGNPLSITSWDLTADHCEFVGIHCSGDHGFVDSINLGDNRIFFPIPASICDLKGLTFFDLSYNNIPGEFPTVIYNCSKLQYIDISQNNFTGDIPADIHKMPSNLTYLDISKNNFTGDIPPAIGLLPAIKLFDLSYNLFNSTIPAEMGNLSTLETLMLEDNPFSPAKISPEFSNLTSLTSLWMSNMNLLGEIPKSFGKLAKLNDLDLGMNSLVGEIPASVWMIKTLKYLELYANKLTGEISSTAAAADGLLVINLSINRLSGSIPEAFGEFKNLSVLDLHANNLTGSIPEAFGELKNLQELYLYANNLTGSIPEAFGELKNLEVLDLSDNNLSGEVPESIGWLWSLYDIRLSNNRLEGVLPPKLGKHSQLLNFEVNDNLFTGELPEHLCDWKWLDNVTASNNQLTGKLAESLGGCDTLHVVKIQNNRFTGTLPAKLPSNLKILEIQNNQFSGRIPSLPQGLFEFIGDNNNFSELPASFNDTSELTHLSLSGNQISGEILVEIMSLTYLNYLDLSNNLLSGQIPDAIGFTLLSTLDLSNNQLSGNIPSNLGLLNFSSLNLSFNDLTGEIPLQLQTQAYVQSFLANPNLCSSNSFFSIQICKNRSNKLSTGLHILLYILGAFIFSIVVVLLCLFITKERRRRKKVGALPSDWKLTTFQAINFNESDILSSLTHDNLIGSGGGGTVYRVSFNPDNTVAVKKIHNTARLHFILEKQFEAEVNIFGSIRHDNIVKLLCCISGENSKLLVYEYLENSSLDRWLHRRRQGNVAPLDWPTRLQIAVGAAKGLCYMHHHCLSPIIHRDVKSSNILLDLKFNAKIADFGLAKILARGGVLETVSTVAGSFGYMAPECSSLKKVNEKVDVYSFGVVLFELVTGKEARDGGEEEYENLTDWAWRRYKDRGAVVDEEIAGESSDQWVKEAEMMFKIGIICTVYNPAERPTMKEVVQMLMMLGRSSDSSGGGGREGSDNNSSGRDVIVGEQAVDIMENSDDSVAT